MHIKSATGEKTVKNIETCAYNTVYYEWLCVRMTLRIMQQLALKCVGMCRWFYKYKKILKVGQQSVLLPIDALRRVVFVPTLFVGGGVVTIVLGMLVRRSQYTDDRAVTSPIFIIDLPIYSLDDLCSEHRWKQNHYANFHYYLQLDDCASDLSSIHQYSALEAGLAGTRAQSCDQYGSGTLHPGQVLGGSLPLLSPAFRLSHFRRQVSVRPQRRERSQKRKVELWARNCPVILPKF